MSISGKTIHCLLCCCSLLLVIQKFFEKLQSPDISVQSLGPDGDSILHAIIRRQFKSRRQKEQKRECLMVLLLHSDIDVNQLNARKTTALHIAVEVNLT